MSDPPKVAGITSLTDALRNDLVARGWVPQSRPDSSMAHLLPESVAYPVQQLQTVVILNPLWGGGMMLTVQVAEVQNGRVPQWLFDQDLESYAATVTNQLVLIADTFPAPEGVDSAAEVITRRAADLAVFVSKMNGPD